MIQGSFIIGIEGTKVTGQLRHDVFTDEYGMPMTEEKDIWDHFAHHLVVRDGDQLVATGRLVYKNDEFLIGRIAVNNEERGKKYGDLVVRMLIDRAISIGADEVTVHAMLPAVDFYKKIGFETFGESYIESTIEHITMRIFKDKFLHSCGGCNGCQ